jgi:archaellum biogenesis ATPase FlaH
MNIKEPGKVVTGGFPAEVGPELLCLADVEPRAVNWLWEPFIPACMLTMLSGDPGTGKSFIALSIAAELSRGRLRDSRIVEPANTLYLSVENPVAESLRPRFDALGGDPARFFLLKGKPIFDADGNKHLAAVTLADLAAIETAIVRVQARLMVVDPIQSYLGSGVDLHRSNETRPVMDGLAKLAEKHGCAILLLRHLSKQVGGKAIHRGLGSVDLTGAVRSEILAGSLPDDADARAMVHIKSNVGRTGRALGYSIDGQGHFEWTGDCQITAEDLLAAPTGPDNGKLAQACEWLKSALVSGEQKQEEIQSLAKSEGISQATLRRAKKTLNLNSRKDGLTGPWIWSLPEDAHDSPEDAQGNCVSTFATVEHLRREIVSAPAGVEYVEGML